MELWRAGRALRESEEVARASFDHAPIGMLRMDGEGRIIAANRALCETLKLGLNELAGKTIAELTHREDRGGDATERAALLAGRRRRYSVEKRLLAAGGSALPALVSFAVARPHEHGDPILLAHVEDLTQRKRAERARELYIREQAARLEAEARGARLRGIQRIADAALSQVPLDELLFQLLERIREVLHVDGTSFVLADDEGGYAVVQAAEAVNTAVRKSFSPVVDGPIERVMHDRRPLIVDDTSQENEAGEALPGAAVSSVLAVPLLTEAQKTLGVLTVG